MGSDVWVFSKGFCTGYFIVSITTLCPVNGFHQTIYVTVFTHLSIEAVRHNCFIVLNAF